MATRVFKLMKELGIGFSTINDFLNAVGYKDSDLTLNSKIPEGVENLLKSMTQEDVDFLKLIESVADKGIYGGSPTESVPGQKIVGSIDLDALGHSARRKDKKDFERRNKDIIPLIYGEKEEFWISDLAVLSPQNKVDVIHVGSFSEVEGQPLYSVLIGANGAGKSTLMKEVVEFFVDLHSCMNDSGSRVSSSNKGRLKGIRYHIDGVDCEVIRLKKSYIAKVDGQIHSLKDLRLPSIVACHFGAFDKFPTQKVSGTAQTKYDVPCYKYVGAHVNGNMISSSAIAFRLLFALNEHMNGRQRENICSILDFIGYDHKVSLSYTFVMKSKKDGAALDAIKQRIDDDREYRILDKPARGVKATQLYNFYKTKTATGKAQFVYDIDFDGGEVTVCSYEELLYIYKLKQFNLISTVNVIFHKQGCDITSEDMSSGEFAMLSTVLSLSAAAAAPHTLVLLDEPELSLHPNWQMRLIDNLDRALKNQACHLLIATHSHMLVSDLPMKRSAVTQLEKDENDRLKATTISESTYGWSAEEVLLKVFKTATDRNRYFGERIGKLLEKMGNNTISQKEVENELKELQEISMHLSDIDPMKQILNTIVETYQ